NLMPTLTVPPSSPPPEPPPSPDPPQAASPSASTDAPVMARMCRAFMSYSSWVWRGQSVGEDLAEEVLGAVTAWVGEELLGGGLLDELPLGHEGDPVGGAAGESHLVGDDDHRHPGVGE